MNIQFAGKQEDGEHKIYVLEVNPRASRTVPFVAKATGFPVAKIATQVMTGKTLDELGIEAAPIGTCVSQGDVFPFIRVAKVSILFLDRKCDPPGVWVPVKGSRLPLPSVRSRDHSSQGRQYLPRRDPTHKEIIKDLAKRLYALGFALMATEGTASIEEVGIPVQRVKKIAEGHPN